MAARTTKRIEEELPRLLAERRTSLRWLAQQVGVQQSHLSRILGVEPRRRATKKIAADIAVALGLPSDYFAEYRRAVVVDAMEEDPAIGDPIYNRLKRRRL